MEQHTETSVGIGSFRELIIRSNPPNPPYRISLVILFQRSICWQLSGPINVDSSQFELSEWSNHHRMVSVFRQFFFFIYYIYIITRIYLFIIMCVHDLMHAFQIHVYTEYH